MNEEINLNPSINGTSEVTEVKILVVLDQCALGLSSASSLNEIYPDVQFITTSSLIGDKEATDSQIADTIKSCVVNGSWKGVEFITSDRNNQNDFSSLLQYGISVIRFSNAELSTATQIYLLTSTFKTSGYKTLQSRSGKDVRIEKGGRVSHFDSGGNHSVKKEINFPHIHSKDHKRFSN